MITREQSRPTVLVFSAHDPSGAAGIQADIESIQANGARSVSVITALTAQNTAEFDSVLPQSPASFRNQLDLLISDISVDACKIGLIGSELLVYEIAAFLTENPLLPVVLDPVLQAGTGTRLDSNTLRTAILDDLVPLATVMTPNLREAMRLTGKKNAASAAADLITRGCPGILVTGADQPTDKVVNTLYTPDESPVEYCWERLHGTYHGSGCTLAASLAALLAGGSGMNTAVSRAQEYTWGALARATQLGSDQQHPNRFD